MCSSPRAVQDQAWSAPVALDADGWKRAGEQLAALAGIAASEGVELVLHPHVGTLAETEHDVELALAHTGRAVVPGHRPPADRRL